MASIGETLKKAREEQGWSVEWVASQLKLRTDYIRAMEEERWDCFPAPIYAKGAVRSYAKLLKLDPEPLVDAVRNALEDEGRLQSYSAVVGSSGQKWLDRFLFNLALIFWRRWVLWLGVLIVLSVCIIGLVVYTRASKRQATPLRPTLVVPSVIPGEKLPVPTRP